MESGQSHGSNPRTIFPSSGLTFSIGPKARVLAPRVEKAFDGEKIIGRGSESAGCGGALSGRSARRKKPCHLPSNRGRVGGGLIFYHAHGPALFLGGVHPHPHPEWIWVCVPTRKPCKGSGRGGTHRHRAASAEGRADRDTALHDPPKWAAQGVV